MLKVFKSFLNVDLFVVIFSLFKEQSKILQKYLYAIHLPSRYAGWHQVLNSQPFAHKSRTTTTGSSSIPWKFKVTFKAAVIAQWISLCLTSYGPWFESQAQNQCITFSNLNCNITKTKTNKKRPTVTPIAMWFRLLHLTLFQFGLLKFEWEKDKNKPKRGQLVLHCPLLLNPRSHIVA